MAPSRVLVVGSVNVDLFQKMSPSSIKLSGKPVDLSSIKGMTLPAKSFVENKNISQQLATAGLTSSSGEEEALVLKMDGPFEQKTGGKGANAAAAAAQTSGCEFICNFGKDSADENKMLLADLKTFGQVDTRRSAFIDGPTGTAYILLYDDNDNAILLLGGANQSWPAAPVAEKGSNMHSAIEDSVAVMLQREVPEYVNVEVAKTATELGKPVVMDVGGTDAPLDEKLLPYISVIAPNETELTFISGVQTSSGGQTTKEGIRSGVAALKAKFAAAGNDRVEVLVTLGPHGSMHFGPQWVKGAEEDIMGLLPHETYMGIFTLSTQDGKPKDTTGAGDAYRGSYVAAHYAEGKNVAEAMRWASAASSLSVEVEGAMPSMPSSKATATRVKTDIQGSGFLTTDAVEMKVSMKKPQKFYVQAALSFLKGLDAKPATESREAMDAKPAVSALRISGLGDACAVAVAAAAQVEADGVGTICAIKTSYPSMGGGDNCAQINIDIKRKN